MLTQKYDRLEVQIADTPQQLGTAVAEAFAEAVADALTTKPAIAVVLATGNSQFGFVEALAGVSVDWSRVTVLHMDEYVGMTDDHPASFRRWMRERIVAPFGPARFEGIRGDHEPIAEEVERYTALLRELEPAITVMGIGENGHLAFNDPPGDFDTDELVTIVTLDDASRRQQVGEGHFASVDETPAQAVTLTIPALLRSPVVLVAVPEQRKAKAVQRALEGEISPESPASILRTQAHARVFLDRDSASLLREAAG